MAEIKLDYANFCNVNRSSPNSCNTSLNQNSSLEKNTMELKSKINRDNNQETDKSPVKSLSQNSLKEKMKDLENKIENLDLKKSKNEHKKSINNFVTIDDIAQIFKAFQERAFKSSEYCEKDERIQLTCLNLFNFDYSTEELMIINNENELSSSYPVKIIVPKTKAFPIDSEKLKSLFAKAKFARCRCRFPVPVILYNNKYICRSATLSHCIEIYSRQGYASFFKTVEDEQIQEITTDIDSINLENYENTSSFFDIIDSNFPKQEDSDSIENKVNINKNNSYFSSFKNEYSQCVNDARTQDIALLDYLNVKQIVDLMVEMKKVKYGVNVASSEKADKLKRYRDFNLIVLPYPGCEFFRCYRNNNYQAEDLIFDWNQNFVDADLNIREDNVIKSLNINYKNYKNWDVNILTLNYLKLILSYLVEPTKESILLHCISGWDRTPLFISLLRLSLWADYELHPNLNHEQILYLTLGYDWYLFGHDLNDRVEKGEEIMHFCFYFLKHLSSLEYSIDYLKKNIIKKGDEFIRTNFICCGACKIKESVIIDKKENEFIKNKVDNKLFSNDIDEEISGSMYSSMASTIVNNNVKNDYVNNFMTSSVDSISEINGEEKKKSTFNKFDNSNFEHMKLANFEENKDNVDLINFSKPFEELSASSSFISYKDLKNKNKTNLNSNTTIENSDLNKFDVISLDEQSISSNSSFDVLNAGKQLNSQNNLAFASNNINISNQCSSSSNNIENNSSQYSAILNENKFKNINRTRKNSFTCGSPPQLVSNVGETIEDNDEVYNLVKKNPCSKLMYEDEDFLSSSGESSTLAEEIDQRTKIQRSNAVAIPRNNTIRERKSKFLVSSNDQINWSNDNGSNNSNLSNTSNKYSDNSFNLNRCDSWQLVTDTGSIRDKNFLSSNSLEEIKRNMGFKINSSNANFPSNVSTPNTSLSNYFKRNNRLCVPTCCCKNLNCGKHCEKVDKFNKENNLEHAIYTRSRRLSDVRALFYQCYSQNIGLTTHTGNTDIISSKFHSLINKTYEKLKYIQFSRANVANINKLTEESITKNEEIVPKDSSFKSYLDEFEEKQ